MYLKKVLYGHVGFFFERNNLLENIVGQFFFRKMHCDLNFEICLTKMHFDLDTFSFSHLQ